MVEIPGYLFQGTLARPAPAPGIGLPAQPQLPSDFGTGAARGAARIGQALQDVSQTIAVISGRMAQARQAEQEAQGVSTGLQLLEEERQAVLLDGSVDPLDRSRVLNERLQTRLDDALQDTPPQVRSRVMLHLAQRQTAVTRELNDEGRRLFIGRATQGLGVVLEQLQRQYLTASSEVDRASIQESAQAIVQSYVSTGILGQEEAVLTLMKLRERTTEVALQNISRVRPAEAVQHLEALASGKRGIEGFPVPAPENVPQYLDQARQQLAQEVQRQTNADRYAEQRLRQHQDAQAVELRTQLSNPQLTLGDVQQVRERANTLARSRELNEPTHAEILRQAGTLERALQQGPLVTNPQVQTRMLLFMHGELGGNDLDLVRTEVFRLMDERQLSIEDGQRYLAEIGRQRQANYYTNIPAYKEGQAFLRQAVNFLDQVSVVSSANAEKLQELQSRTAYALQAYSETLRTVWQDGGPRVVEETAAQEARRLQQLFAVTPEAVLEFFPRSPALDAAQGATVGERYEDAYRRLQGDAALTDTERAEQYRLLRIRQRIDEQIVSSTSGQRQNARQAPAQTVPPPAAQPPGFLQRLLGR